jgi:hypothetical protein
MNERAVLTSNKPNWLKMMNAGSCAMASGSCVNSRRRRSYADKLRELMARRASHPMGSAYSIGVFCFSSSNRRISSIDTIALSAFVRHGRSELGRSWEDQRAGKAARKTGPRRVQLFTRRSPMSDLTASAIISRQAADIAAIVESNCGPVPKSVPKPCRKNGRRRWNHPHCHRGGLSLVAGERSACLGVSPRRSTSCLPNAQSLS